MAISEIEMDDLLQELVSLGVDISAHDGQLRIQAAKGVFTPDLQERVKRNKLALVDRLSAGASLPPIVPASGDDGLPFGLADLQLGFYIANDPHMEFHVRPHWYMEFDRPELDVGRYLAAWNKALRRHARELCVVTPQIELRTLPEFHDLDFDVMDLRDADAAQVRDALAQTREGMMRSELPLDCWPWFDLRITRWREGGHERARIHYNHNNYFIDGFGTVQLLAEIDGYYRDPALTLPPNAISYRDAVLALERAAGSARGIADRDYWFSRLEGMPPPPPLPLKPGMNRRCRSRLNRREGELDKATWDAFKSACGARGITPSNAVTTAYAFLIATWSNCDRFVLSHMSTRRIAELHPDISRILGNFASLYPLEISLSPDASFTQNAHALQRRVLEDMQHLTCGGMRVLQELNRLKGGFGSSPIPFVIGSGLFMKTYPRADFSVLETSQVMLDHQFFELEDGSYYYVWDLLEEFFPDGMVDDMWQVFADVLRTLARDPAAWDARDLCAPTSLDLAERAARNRSKAPVPDMRLHETLSISATAYADQVFVASPGRRMRYDECERRSAALAMRLHEQGVVPGEFVAIVMDRTPALVVAAMAVLRTAAAYVPVDPKLPPERIALLIADSGARVALVDAHHQDRLALVRQCKALVIDASSSPMEGEGIGSIQRPAPQDLAYMIYTSGSTGRPKGVLIDHRGAINTIADINRRFDIGTQDCVFGVSAFNFDLSVYDIFGVCAAGARLIYPDPASALDPNHWLDLVLAEGVTVWNSVPALMSLLIEVAERRGVRLERMREVLLSGDKIPLDLPDAIRRVAPNARVTSLGGATEASIWSIHYPIAEIDPQWVTVPYGYPMDNQSWDVVDRRGRPCARWVPGDLLISGIGLAQGYWNDPERSAASFRADGPGGERRYRTGDIGRYLPGGAIEWLGRSDFQVKIQGHRIELGEIETALQEHPAVAQAVVTVHAAQSSKARLVAHVASRDGLDAADQGDRKVPDMEALERYLQSRLPAYMVPSLWRLVDRIPLSANGKVDRRALQEASIGGDADEEAFVPGGVAPQGEDEFVLQRVWEEVLGRPVGVTDDFFLLGGQSFDAIRIFARIKETFGHRFGLSDIWMHRSVRSLALALREGDPASQVQRLVPLLPAGDGAPLCMVHPAGGSVLAYLPLARALGRPFFAFQALPDDAALGVRRDIPTMASHYVRAIREQGLTAPFDIGGWSSGASLAYEIACRLRSEGERVGRVYLLDGPTPGAHVRMGDAELLRWFVQDLGLGLPLERLEGLFLPEHNLQAQLEAAADALRGEDLSHFDIDQLLPAYSCFRDMVAACAAYQPKALDVPVTVVRVEEDQVEEFAEHPDRKRPDWGWGRYAHAGIDCLKVAGTHYSFLSEAAVGDWCGALTAAERCP
jgi:amino acid adenylation domain-containing protein